MSNVTVNQPLVFSNTFGNMEIYIPSYNVSQNKPFGVFAVTENNATDSRIFSNASLWRSTSAITAVRITAQSSYFVNGSTANLYGITAA